jgi:hypothetical protein
VLISESWSESFYEAGNGIYGKRCLNQMWRLGRQMDGG